MVGTACWFVTPRFAHYPLSVELKEPSAGYLALTELRWPLRDGMRRACSAPESLAMKLKPVKEALIPGLTWTARGRSLAPYARSSSLTQRAARVAVCHGPERPRAHRRPPLRDDWGWGHWRPGYRGDRHRGRGPRAHSLPPPLKGRAAHPKRPDITIPLHGGGKGRSSGSRTHVHRAVGMRE